MKTVKFIRKRFQFFTLIELLVAMTIIVILLGVGTRSYNKIKTSTVYHVNVSAVNQTVAHTSGAMQSSGVPAVYMTICSSGDPGGVYNVDLFGSNGTLDSVYTFSGNSGSGFVYDDYGLAVTGRDLARLKVESNLDTGQAFYTELMIKRTDFFNGLFLGNVITSDILSISCNNNNLEVNGLNDYNNPSITIPLQYNVWHKLGIFMGSGWTTTEPEGETLDGSGQVIADPAVDCHETMMAIIYLDGKMYFSRFDGYFARDGKAKIKFTVPNEIMVDEIKTYGYKKGNSIARFNSKDAIVAGYPGTYQVSSANDKVGMIIGAPNQDPVGVAFQANVQKGGKAHNLKTQKSFAIATAISAYPWEVAKVEDSTTGVRYEMEKKSVATQFLHEGPFGYAIVARKDGNAPHLAPDEVQMKKGKYEIVSQGPNGVMTYEVIKYELQEISGTKGGYYLLLKDEFDNLAATNSVVDNKSLIGYSRNMYNIFDYYGKDTNAGNTIEIKAGTKIYPAKVTQIGFNGAVH